MSRSCCCAYDEKCPESESQVRGSGPLAQVWSDSGRELLEFGEAQVWSSKEPNCFAYDDNAALILDPTL